jgi:hypothetical protein
MKLLIATSALLLAWSVEAMAQTSEHYRAQGYLFFAPGVSTDHEAEFSSATLHLGGGGEGFIYRGMGLGAELGYVALWSASGDGPGMGSVNVSYHFFHRAPERNLEPFVTGGYSLFARHGTVSSGNFGGGINYWLGSRAAVRFEARYQGIGLHIPYFGGAAPNVEFRIGATWK